MIQRIQTLYLFITIVLLGLLSILPLAYGVQEHVVPIRVWGVNGSLWSLSSTALLVLVFLLAWVTIFRYRHRKQQKQLCLIQVAILIVAIMLQAISLYALHAVLHPITISVAAVFPVVSIVLLLLAYRGISKDEKLIRSLDRIR